MVDLDLLVRNGIYEWRKLDWVCGEQSSTLGKMGDGEEVGVLAKIGRQGIGGRCGWLR